jgi:16S rRNA (cytidine1402-2'-O)-methyltransferase
MSKLYLVPTPVGNLEDMTFRAVRILQDVDVILAEDTRVSGKLLKHYSIETRMRSHHEHNEHARVDGLVDEIRNGKSIAVITDAGTPGISDPGFLLVRACVEAGIQIEALPGATAFVPALVLSGLPCDRFVFEGFLPQKKGRKTRLELLAEEKRTMVFYESPYRVQKTIDQFIEYFGGERQAAMLREISKMYEEQMRGTLEEMKEALKERKLKGEVVLIVAGRS